MSLFTGGKKIRLQEPEMSEMKNLYEDVTSVGMDDLVKVAANGQVVKVGGLLKTLYDVKSDLFFVRAVYPNLYFTF